MTQASTSMRVVVKLFATAREKAGVSQAVLELPAGATVNTAAEELGRRYAGLVGLMAGVAFAVNCAYAPRETALRDGDELAVIPPVSGG